MSVSNLCGPKSKVAAIADSAADAAASTDLTPEVNGSEPVRNSDGDFAATGSGDTQPAAPEAPAETIDPVASTTPAVDEAELARLALLEEQRARETKYAAALKPIDQQVSAWDFAAAWQLAESLHFDEPELTTHLESRRDEIRRMEVLKRRIIAKISASDPPLRKSDLAIRGINGDIANAGPAGITARSLTGEEERITWADLGTQAAGKLMELAVEPGNGEDLIAAGLLSFAAGDRKAAERFYQQAKSAGADVSAQRAAMAANMLAEANERLSREEFVETVKLLEALKDQYADTPWWASNRETFDAAMATARKGVREDEAEALYAQAVKLHDEKALFELRDVLTRLTTDYADSQPMVDAERQATIAEMEKTIQGLGVRLIVRQDGKGDFTSIQAAIDAAQPNSLIQIQDNGPYNEKVLVAGKEGLTISGQEGYWPLITWQGGESEPRAVLEVRGAGTRIERLLVVNVDIIGRTSCAFRVSAPNVTVQSVAIAVKDGNGFHNTQHQNRTELRDCLFLGEVMSYEARYANCLFVAGVQFGDTNAQIRGCTSPSTVICSARDDVISESILGKVQINPNFPDHRIDNCVFFKGEIPQTATNCALANPLFANPQMLDYRLAESSPCKGKATDGGDLGCRYTPEMIEMCQIALELRKQGLIKF